MKRIVSLLPAATEIAAALGLMDQVVGVSHECDFPSTANERPRVTHCPIHHSGLASSEVDAWVRRALRENGTIYTIDEPLLRKLRPDVILTQKLCDVCAVGYGTVARLAATLPEPPTVLNLEPSSLADILENIRQVAEVCGVPERADSGRRRSYLPGWKRCGSAPRKFTIDHVVFSWNGSTRRSAPAIGDQSWLRSPADPIRSDGNTKSQSKSNGNKC